MQEKDSLTNLTLVRQTEDNRVRRKRNFIRTRGYADQPRNPGVCGGRGVFPLC